MASTYFKALPLTLLPLVLACSDSEPLNPFGEGGDELGTVDDDSSSSGSSEDADDATDTDEGVKLDMAPPPDDAGAADDTAGDEGCEKVDFLFVIDNSNSMSDEQQLLIDSFPGFIDAIADTLPAATDFHVGVTKTDIFGFDDSPTPDPANPCSYQLGGLLSHATVDGEKTGIGADCNFSSAAQYMVNGPNLATEFACVAKVGTKGNTGERQAEATIAALEEQGECSAGFLRNDALLVVVVITDEDDDWSAPDADTATNSQAWYDAVVARKGGIETNVVFLLVSGGSPAWGDCGPLDLQTMTGADDSPNLTAWAQKFTNVTTGSVCAPNYGAYLAESISVIETACDEFQPIP